MGSLSTLAKRHYGEGPSTLSPSFASPDPLRLRRPTAAPTIAHDGSGQGPNPLKSDSFTQAVEAKDGAALTAALAADVVFRSPVVFRPYEGRDLVSTILVEAAMKVLEDLRYVHRFEDGAAAALIFKARVGNRDVDGLDLLRFDDDGKVAELTVMVRPMSGLRALAEAMGHQFERLGIAPPVG
jgi:hypothetical protein